MISYSTAMCRTRSLSRCWWTGRSDSRYLLLRTLEITGTNFDDENVLLSWWTGDATVRDVAGPNNGTLMGGATFGEARILDSAFSFDGVDDYVAAPTANLPVSNRDRTLEMWIYANSFPSTSEETFFAGYGAFGTYNQTYHLGSTGPNLFFSSGEAASGTCTDGEQVASRGRNQHRQ